MAVSNIKHNVLDPAIYDIAIKEQWKPVRKHPKDAGQWLELGRLYEATLMD